MKEIIFNVNGRNHRINCQENWTLLYLIREVVRLKGSKEVCGIGECGACTMIVNGRPVSSCCELAIRVDGSKVQTIEGLAVDGQLHPLQKSFIENSAFQCGFCTSGMIMMAKTLLDSSPKDLSDSGIRDYMAGNLCRCTGYVQIIEAIKEAAGAMKTTQELRN